MGIVPPRGVRNNNPGNIDYNPRNVWVGQLGIEQGVNKPRFARFDTPENGIRAIAKLLRNYYKKDLFTVRDMIDRWAPPSENDTGAYVNQVARAVGIGPDEIIKDLGTKILIPMVAAIIRHENGFNPYDDLVITEGVLRAMK